MARFSQQMLAGLLNPAYQQELTSAARGLGQTPAIMGLQREEKEKKQKLAEIYSTAMTPGTTSVQLFQTAQQLMTQGNTEEALALLAQARELQETEKAAEKETKQTKQEAIKEGVLSAAYQAGLEGKPFEMLRGELSTFTSVPVGGKASDFIDQYQAGVDLAKGEKPEIIQGTPGSQFFTRDEYGNLVLQKTVPFKRADETASKGIKTVTREDGSVTILDADDGSVISTLDAPGKGEGDRDASLNLIAQTTGFIQEVDKLMDPSFTETGFIGGVTAAVPGTPAYDREKELLSIRARLGFDQINEMKRLAAESGASGTGLGQISNIEFMSLQSTIDAIYVGMSGEAQNEALANIKKHLLNVQKLASGVAPADAIEWERPEYKAVGYHKDPDTGNVYYAPDGRNGKRYKLVDGKFQQLGRVPTTPLGNTPVN